MDESNDLISGKVPSKLLGFFFPMLLTNFFQQIYSVADTAIIGKGLSDHALGAVGNLSSLSLLIIGFSMGVTGGFAVIIAQNYGAGDRKAVQKSIALSVKLSAVITVILTVAGCTLLKPILFAMQTDQALIADGLKYGYIIMGGLAATVAYNLCSSILRSLGDSRTPFIAIILSSAVNIALDYLLIFIFHTGVEGAAAATIFAQGLSAFICFLKIKESLNKSPAAEQRILCLIRAVLKKGNTYSIPPFSELSAEPKSSAASSCRLNQSFLKHTSNLQFRKEDFSGDKKIILLLLKNGMPMALMNSITALGCMVVQRYVNDCGAVFTSAYSVCSKYLNLFMLPSLTAGFSVSVFVSQNYGAGKTERIRQGIRVCLGIALVSYLLLGSVMVLLPKQLAGFMLNQNETISLTAQYLRICGAGLILLNLLFVYRNVVQGMGYAFIPMLSGIAEMVLRIPAIILLLPSIGFKATAYAEWAAWIGALLLNIVGFRHYINRANVGAQK